MIALLLLCGSLLLDLLFASAGRVATEREFLTQWKGIASFGALAAVTAVSYLYSPAQRWLGQIDSIPCNFGRSVHRTSCFDQEGGRRASLTLALLVCAVC